MGRGNSGRLFEFSRGGGARWVGPGERPTVTLVGRNSGGIRRYIPSLEYEEGLREAFLSGLTSGPQSRPISKAEILQRLDEVIRRQAEAQAANPGAPAYLEYNYPTAAENEWNRIVIRLRRKYGLPVRTIEDQRRS